MKKPIIKPDNPQFSSGPCPKRPGWTTDTLEDALIGRSHRSKPGKAKLKSAIAKTREILEDFTAKLQSDLGVTFDDQLNPVFGPLSVQHGPSQQAIRNTINAVKSIGDDALNAHLTKKNVIDEAVSFGPESAQGIAVNTERVLKDLRGNINNRLRDLSDDYRNANNKFSETMQPIEDFKKAAGRNFNIDSPNVNEFLGKLSRRLLSNIQSREKLLDSIVDLEKVGIKHGGRFGDDIMTQISMVDELEKTFGAFAPTGLQAEVAKGMTQAIRGDKAGIIADVAGKGIEKARRVRVNEDQALKALRKLFKRGNK